MAILPSTGKFGLRRPAVNRKIWFATPRGQPENLSCDAAPSAGNCGLRCLPEAADPAGSQPDPKRLQPEPKRSQSDPSQIPEEPKQIPIDPHQIPTTGDQIPNGPDQSLPRSQMTPIGSHTIPTRSQMIPTRSQTVPSKTQMIPTTSKVVLIRRRILPVYNLTRTPSHLITCTRWSCVVHIFVNCVQCTFTSHVKYTVFLSLFWFGLARCDQAKFPALPLACRN